MLGKRLVCQLVCQLFSARPTPLIPRGALPKLRAVRQVQARSRESAVGRSRLSARFAAIPRAGDSDRWSRGGSELSPSAECRPRGIDSPGPTCCAALNVGRSVQGVRRCDSVPCRARRAPVPLQELRPRTIRQGLRQRRGPTARRRRHFLPDLRAKGEGAVSHGLNTESNCSSGRISRSVSVRPRRSSCRHWFRTRLWHGHSRPGIERCRAPQRTPL